MLGEDAQWLASGFLPLAPPSDFPRQLLYTHKLAVPAVKQVLFHVTQMFQEVKKIGQPKMTFCVKIIWICHFVTRIFHPILRHIAVDMKYLVPAVWSFLRRDVYWKIILVRLGTGIVSGLAYNI